MELRFGTSFAAVRVHSDARAAVAAQTLHARAFTSGEHVVMGRGAAAPGTREGKRLLAHELTHVVQQRARPATGERPALQRYVEVKDASATPTHGSFGSRTRGRIFVDWLNTLCPQGNFQTNGNFVTVASPSICFDYVFNPSRAAQNPRQTSCRCACDAWDDLTPNRKTDLYIHHEIPLPARRRGATPNRSLAPYGGAITIDSNSPQSSDFVVPSWQTIIMTGTGNVALPGAGDPQSRTAGKVSTPPWLVFAHEFCGHVYEKSTARWSSHMQTPQGDSTAVDVENQIRREHGFGTRAGSLVSSGRLASAWRLQSGDTVASLELRFGVLLRGLAAWDPLTNYEIEHKNLFLPGEFWVTRDELPATNRTQFMNRKADEMLTRARAQHGGEVAIMGISWDHVRPNDTWRRIARRWRVRAGGGKSGARRVRDANAGLTGLTPGARVVIPARTVHRTVAQRMLSSGGTRRRRP